MANNVDILDAVGATKTTKTTDNIGVHTSHVNVDSAALPTDASTETTLAAINTKLASGTVIGDVNLGAVDNAVLDAIAASLAGTLAVTAASLPLPSGAATAAAQLADGHNVTVDNAAGAAAVNVQDGGNSITVDGTFFQATQPVSLASVPSHAVTNAGTFATQAAATLTAETTKVIGAVNHPTTGIGHGTKVLTTAGTDLVLSASQAAKWVCIQAMTDNTGVMAIGATGVDATVATGTGVALAAGESITIPCDNLADIFFDATVSGDAVRYTYGI